MFLTSIIQTIHFSSSCRFFLHRNYVYTIKNYNYNTFSIYIGILSIEGTDDT